MYDVLVMNEKLLYFSEQTSYNQSTTFTINERTLFQQRTVRNEPTIFTIREPAMYNQ